jgi:hypothetical protein
MQWPSTSQSCGTCRANPLSLALTFENMCRGRHGSLADTLRLDFRLAARLSLHLSDLHEGVRCRLIDKHGSVPKWSYSMVGKVPAAVIASFFEPLEAVPELALPAVCDRLGPVLGAGNLQVSQPTCRL